ncbi:MAG TPA: ABC transporter permease subunit [Thermoplasmata archaeon]|nr:ABC transporter permease subunit [Thermoplasmata archaeon]
MSLGRKDGPAGSGPGSLTSVSPRILYTLAKKEFLDNVRSKWILGITFVFVVLSLVISYFGAAQSGGDTGFRDPRDTAAGMAGLSRIMVPIISLMLGYGTIVNEKEQGSLALLLSMPITRIETVLGKFMGLGSVIATSIVAGLGLGGLIIIGAAGGDGGPEYAAVIGGTVLSGLSFLGVGMLISTVSRSRGMALGLAVVCWFFFVIIFTVILIGVLFATGGVPQGGPGGPSSSSLPDWFFGAQLANPATAYDLFSNVVLGQQGPLQSGGYPGFVSAGTAAASMVIWAVWPLLLSMALIDRQDL